MLLIEILHKKNITHQRKPWLNQHIGQKKNINQISFPSSHSITDFYEGLLKLNNLDSPSHKIALGQVCLKLD